MSTFINLHILQPFSYANPNRDDTGAPKSAVYGGTIRGRISSQSWKRAIRLGAEDALDVQTFRASPGGCAQKIAELLQADAQCNLGRDEAWIAGWIATASFSNGKIDNKAAWAAFDKQFGTAEDGKESEGNEDSGSALAWFSATELQQIASALNTSTLTNEDLGKSKSSRSKIVSALKKIRDSGFGPTEVTIGAFGRMYADAPGAKVDAAMQVAHALTTSEMSHQIDYFTAVDDLKDGQGAGHLGLGQFTGGIYYRYISINVDELRQNCGGLDPTALKVLIEQSIVAIPSGKQNSTANHEAPLAVLAEVRDRSLSYATAFETPVPSQGGAEASVAALYQFVEQVETMQLTPARGSWAASSTDLDAGHNPTRSLIDLVAAVVDAVS